MPITLGTGALGITDVVAVARDGAGVELGGEAYEKLNRARHLIERWAKENKPIYGVTRGLGGRVTMEVGEAERNSYSAAVVRARATGGGGYFDRQTTRAALFSRAAALAMGGAGVRPLIIETQIAMLERGVHPLVPQVGSVGASDLALCANLALPLMGEGRAEYAGEILPGREAMRRAGIPVVQLLEKEGLALCSANSISVGLGALVLQQVGELVELADAIVALSFEAFRANLSPIDERVVEARPAPGQRAAAHSIRQMLSGSELFLPGAARRVQDPISFRCASHVHGAVRAGLDFARPNIEIELNSTADNPLILLDDEDVLSTGNFHTPAMSIAFDALRLALSEMSNMSSERVARMMQPELTGLEGQFLSSRGVTRSGLGLLRIAAHTLMREVRYYAAPVSHDDSTALGVEDQAPFTPVAIRRTAQQLEYLVQVLACELIVSAQALDIRAPRGIAPVAQTLRDLVRTEVAALDDDRTTTEDIEAVTAMIRSGKALAIVREARRLPTSVNRCA